MKTIGIIILSIFGIIISALLGGLMFMKFYEWCIIPVGISFNYTFPHISYGLFVMLDIGIALLKSNRETFKDENSAIDIVKSILGKLFLFGILWVASLIIL